MRSLLLALIFVFSVHADYYTIRAKGGSAYIYSSAGSGGATTAGKKGKKSYIAKVGDLHVRKVKYVSDAGEYTKISFYDSRARITRTGFVKNSEISKVLVEEAKTKEEIRAEKKASTTAAVSLKIDLVQTLKKSFGLKSTKDFINFIKHFPKYTSAYQTEIEGNYRKLESVTAKVDELVPQAENLVKNYNTLTKDLETTKAEVLALNKSKTELTELKESNKKELSSLEQDINTLTQESKEKVKSTNIQAYAFAFVAALVGFYFGSRFA